MGSKPAPSVLQIPSTLNMRRWIDQTSAVAAGRIFFISSPGFFFRTYQRPRVNLPVSDLDTQPSLLALCPFSTGKPENQKRTNRHPPHLNSSRARRLPSRCQGQSGRRKDREAQQRMASVAFRNAQKLIEIGVDRAIGTSGHLGLVPEPQKPAKRVLLDWQVPIELEKCLSRDGPKPSRSQPQMTLSRKFCERAVTGTPQVFLFRTVWCV